MKEIFKFLENKLPWGVLGGIIGLLGVIGSLYFSLYYEKTTEILFQIEDELNILDVKKPLDHLEIYFEGDEIQKNNLNLKVIKLKIINSGQVDILQNHYDKNEDWGFEIGNGKIIEIRSTSTNSEYLEGNINPNIENGDLVKFEKIIFDKDNYITFEILVLHNKDYPPNIIPMGKIAGIKNFEVTNSITNGKETSLISKLFYGDFKTNIIRLLMSFFVIISLLILTLIVSIYIGKTADKVAKSKRKKKLKRMNLSKDDTNTICQSYIEGDYVFLENLNYLIKSEKNLKNTIEIMNLENQYSEELKKISGDEKLSYYDNFMFLQQQIIQLENSKNKIIHMSNIPKINSLLNNLIEEKKIVIEDTQIIIDEEFKRTLDCLIAVIS